MDIDNVESLVHTNGDRSEETTIVLFRKINCNEAKSEAVDVSVILNFAENLACFRNFTIIFGLIAKIRSESNFLKPFYIIGHLY